METARAFNPFLVAKSDKLKKLIEEVQQQIEVYEAYHQTRQRARRAADQKTHERMIEAIVCDLCLLHLDPQYDAVHLPLSNKVLRKASRYKSPVLGKTLPDLLNIMTAPEMDFVVLNKGHKNFRIIDQDLNVVPTEGVQSTLAPGPKLLSRIERFGVTEDDIAWSDEQEPIVLRSTKTPGQEVAEAVEYADTQQTDTLRAEMNSINAYLAEADITCDYRTVNPQDRYLRRIFNNGSFDQGGRLYGGFWQKMTSEERAEHIRINQDAVVECDYGQMSLLLLYAEAGAQEDIPEGDLYDLSAYGIPQECRRGIKKTVQAIINSPTLPTRLPKGARKYIPSRISLQDILSAIQNKHSKVYMLMTSNLGMQLFRKESDILVDVLLTLQKYDVVALPIHDAVLVADEDKETTITVMKEVFQKYTGIIPEVTQ
ncbi:MAG: hypothetical protein O3A90_07110 [Proteobacteria bacterium]|nr:hypothetical protein [Pseudomonadota bacterium]